MARLSIQRQAILQLINQSNHHWDAEEVARALSDAGQRMGIATVYRGLAALEAAALIDSIQVDNKKRYERANKAHHDHLVCHHCGKIEEFVNSQIESLQQQICQQQSFRMTGHQLMIVGICKHCQQKDLV